MTDHQVLGSLVSIRTAALARARAFYAQLLGAPLREQPGKWCWFTVPGAGLVIWFGAGESGAGESGAGESGAGLPGASQVEVCLTVADIEASHAWLATWTCVSAIQTASHGRECFLHDPDGNRVVMYQPFTTANVG